MATTISALETITLVTCTTHGLTYKVILPARCRRVLVQFRTNQGFVVYGGNGATDGGAVGSAHQIAKDTLVELPAPNSNGGRVQQGVGDSTTKAIFVGAVGVDGTVCEVTAFA